MADAELPPDAPPAFHILKAAIDEARADAKTSRELVQRMLSKDGQIALLSNQVLDLYRAIRPVSRWQQIALIVIVSAVTAFATVAVAK